MKRLAVAVALAVLTVATPGGAAQAAGPGEPELYLLLPADQVPALLAGGQGAANAVLTPEQLGLSDPAQGFFPFFPSFPGGIGTTGSNIARIDAMTSLLGFSPAGAAGLGGLGLGGTTGFAGLGTGVGGQSFLLGGPGLARAGLGGITLNTALSTGCPVPGIGFCPFFTASPFTSTFPAAGGTLGLSASPSFLGGGLLGGGLLGGALTIPGTGNTVIVVR